MKKCTAFILTLLALLPYQPLTAYAGKITLSNPDEQELKGGGKRLCTYESPLYLFTLVTRSQSCPFSKTVDTLDNEK